ncbi:MAG: hypothetical protein LLF78_04155 [Synergistaceae bacterium]|nr:hypothetical protein [Synergistaceae bacterium]
MDMQPSGYLPFQVAPQPDDGLIFSPAYIFPVEILERGIMSRPKYLFQTVVVDGYDGRATLIEKRDLIPDAEFVPGDVRKEYLDLKISPDIAPYIAESGAVPPDCRSWRRAVKNRKVMVRTNGMKLVWRVYAVRGGEVLDTFSGEVINSAGLLGMLFG